MTEGWAPRRPAEALASGELTLHGRVLPASNATFVGEIGEVTVVYKPTAGERPLWDFPDGTLAGREVASYLVSEALGWDVVPLTFLRDGPHGPGMVQVWREPAEGHEAVDLVPEGQVPPGWRHVFDGLDAHDRPISLIHEDSAPLRRMAVLDVLLNNADRKGGHVLAMGDGHRYGVDHGVCLHVEHKLRTVLWGWAGEPLEASERSGVQALLGPRWASLDAALGSLVTAAEVAALRQRAERLLRADRLPEPGDHWPVIPWPPF